MTMDWLERFLFWGWQGKDQMLYTLWPYPWRWVKRCTWRWTGREGLIICSSTRVRLNKLWTLVPFFILCHNHFSFPCLSGQHLITALADTMFGYKTTSWYVSAHITFSVHVKTWAFTCSCSSLRDLACQKSTIELDTHSVQPAQLQELEEVVNEKIRAHVPVNVKLLSLDDPAVEKVCTHLLCFTGTQRALTCCVDIIWLIHSVFVQLTKPTLHFAQTICCIVVKLHVFVSTRWGVADCQMTMQDRFGLLILKALMQTCVVAHTCLTSATYR